MLLTLLFTPLLGCILNTLVNYSDSQNKTIYIKNIGLFTSILTFFIAIIMWSQYDPTINNYQFLLSFDQIFRSPVLLSTSEYNLNIGIDGISLYFVILTTLLTPVVILSNWNNLQSNYYFYITLILILEFLLIAVFLVIDLLIFYILFESILPPLFLLIGIFGSNRKILASYHIFLYTLFGSFFLLLALLSMYYLTGTTNFIFLNQYSIDLSFQKVLWLAIFFSIMIKTPLFPFHLWLPLAHSEAPLGGSVLLAGVILKLALYAILRILIPILPEATLYFTPFVYSICVITIIYASLTTLRQIDLKVIIAYSSISHMAVCILGVFSNNILGLDGSIYLGLAHGLVSPALFIIVGGILYDRYHTRILSYYRGLIQFMPILSLFFFIFTLANMGTPLTANFIGEFLCLSGAFQNSPLLTSFSSLSIVLSAAYSIYLFNRISGGVKSHYLTVVSDINRREFYILFPLLLLTILLGISPNFILSDIEYSLSNLIYIL